MDYNVCHEIGFIGCCSNRIERNSNGKDFVKALTALVANSNHLGISVDSEDQGFFNRDNIFRTVNNDVLQINQNVIGDLF